MFKNVELLNSPLQGMENIYWYVSIKGWNPSPEYWHALLTQLPLAEQHKVAQFLLPKDQKFAFLSYYLQRLVIARTFDLRECFDRIPIARTKANKPYYDQKDRASEWNYNVSHHGSVIAIATDIAHDIGIDLMDIHERPKVGKETFFHQLESVFTSNEWSCIREGQEAEEYRRLYQFWTMKEAYLKARGIGLGLNLRQLECQLVPPRLTIDPDVEEISRRRNWCFHVEEVSGHCLTLARDAEVDVRPSWTEKTIEEVIHMKQVLDQKIVKLN